MYEQQRENIVKLLEEVRSLKAQKEQDQKAWTVWKNKYEEMSKQNERCNKVIAEYERKAWSEVNGSLPLDRRAKLDKAHESLKEMVSSGMIHSGVTSLLKDILDLFEPDPKLWFWLGSSVQAEADKQTGFVGSAPDLPPGTVCQRKK